MNSVTGGVRWLKQRLGSESESEAVGIHWVSTAYDLEDFLKTLMMVKITLSLKIFHKVRLRIHSVGVNFGDILMVQGQYQEKPHLPFTPGLITALL